MARRCGEETPRCTGETRRVLSSRGIACTSGRRDPSIYKLPSPLPPQHIQVRRCTSSKSQAGGAGQAHLLLHADVHALGGGAACEDRGLHRDQKQKQKDQNEEEEQKQQQKEKQEKEEKEKEILKMKMKLKQK